MPIQTIYALGDSEITVSGGGQLSGITQGDGSHLVGLTITLNSNAWEAVDIDDATGDNNLADNDNTQTWIAGETFDGQGYSAGSRVESEFAITVEDPDGNEYRLLAFNVNEGGGVSYATVEGLAFVGGVGGFPPINTPLTVTGAFEGPSDGYVDLATPICFAAGGRVATPAGLRAVEDLCVGEDVLDIAGRVHRVEALRINRFPAALLSQDARFRPYRIRAHAFGPGMPKKDVRLSPQHRVLLTGWRAEMLFGEPQVLVPIKALANDATICQERAGRDITYVHIELKTHAVLSCEGLPAESYWPLRAAQEADPWDVGSAARGPAVAPVIQTQLAIAAS